MLHVLQTGSVIVVLLLANRQDMCSFTPGARRCALALSRVVCLTLDVESESGDSRKSSAKGQKVIEAGQGTELPNNRPHPVDLMPMPMPPLDSTLTNGHPPRRRLSPLRNRVVPGGGNGVGSRPASNISVKSAVSSSTSGWFARRPSWRQLAVCLNRLLGAIFLLLHALVHFIFILVLSLS